MVYNQCQPKINIQASLDFNLCFSSRARSKGEIMLYQPKFCCNCGAEIQRIEWHWYTSGRFCELCETQYKFYDFVPRIVVGIAVFFGIAGIGFYLQKPENPLNASRHQIAGNVGLADKNAANRNASLLASIDGGSHEKPAAGTNAATGEIRSTAQAVPEKKVLPTSVKQVDNQKNAVQETIYFCGAETKKGTPCSRRVKGGGRCWQHVGQPAMLTPEKLIAVQ